MLDIANQRAASVPVTWGDLYLMCVNMGLYGMANYCLDQILDIDATKP